MDPTGNWLQVAWKIVQILWGGASNAWPLFQQYYKAHGKNVRGITPYEWGKIGIAFVTGAVTTGIGIKISTLQKVFGMTWYEKFVGTVTWEFKKFMLNNVSRGVNPYDAAKSLYKQLQSSIVKICNYFW